MYTNYSSQTNHMSAALTAVRFQSTSELDTETTMPRGNVQMIPAPMVAGSETLRKKLAGTVGPVPQATAVEAEPVGPPWSSASPVLGRSG